MTFTSIGTQAVSAFAAQLGLEARPARDGSYGFLFSRAGHFSVTSTPRGERVTVSLARVVAPSDTARLARLLGLAGFDPGTNRVVQAGLTGDGAVHLAVSLNERELSATLLDATLSQLAALHDRAA